MSALIYFLLRVPKLLYLAWLILFAVVLHKKDKEGIKKYKRKEVNYPLMIKTLVLFTGISVVSLTLGHFLIDIYDLELIKGVLYRK